LTEEGEREGSVFPFQDTKCSRHGGFNYTEELTAGTHAEASSSSDVSPFSDSIIAYK
jgi:hypothetical protein